MQSMVQQAGWNWSKAFWRSYQSALIAVKCLAVCCVFF